MLSTMALRERIAAACVGMVFISETDSPFTPIFCGKGSGGVSDRLEHKFPELLGAKLEISSFDDLFRRLTAVHDWFGDAERHRAAKAKEMETIFREELTELTVASFGSIQVQIFVVGIDRTDNLLGVRTFAVET